MTSTAAPVRNNASSANNGVVVAASGQGKLIFASIVNNSATLRYYYLLDGVKSVPSGTITDKLPKAILLGTSSDTTPVTIPLGNDNGHGYYDGATIVACTDGIGTIATTSDSAFDIWTQTRS